MLAGINGKIQIVVVKCRRHPGSLSMTAFTGRRELCSLVVGVVGIVVIRLMASVTGVGRIVVVALVTGKTIVCNIGVCALQDIIVVVDGERGGGPSRLGGVAIGAVLRDVQCHVPWIGGTVVIRQMAAYALVRSIVVIPLVAGKAIVLDRQMRTVDQPVVVVYVECGRSPSGCGGVAALAIPGQIEAGVGRIDRRIEITAVTSVAGIRRVDVIPVMAALAVVAYLIMRTIQHVKVVVNVEPRRSPTGLCRMAGGAIIGDSQCNVVGIGRLVEIVLVTIIAYGGSAFVSILMAIQAIGHEMRTGQRELAHVVIKGHFLFAGGMTGQTGKAGIKISTHTQVIVICLWIDVASGASEYFEIGWIAVTLAAVVPDRFVRACVNRKIKSVVVEGGRSPGRFTVAGRTILRKLGGQVIGVGRLLVILPVTAHTLVGCVVVSVLMTALAIIAD